MIQNFAVDQARTFVSLHLLGVDAKTAFGAPQRQEVSSKDGTPSAPPGDAGAACVRVSDVEHRSASCPGPRR